MEAESGPCPPNLIPSVLAYLRHASSCFTTDMYINLRCASAADMDAFQPSLVEALASLQNLRSLCLVANQAIKFENLKALASLPCLQKLKIENPSPNSDFVTNAPLTADNEPPPPAHVFRALQRLKLKPYRLRDAPVVLSSFAFPSLEALSVDTKANSQSKHVYRIMRLASMRCSHDKLTNIWVGGGEYGEEYAENEIGAITTASLGHLCAFPNLTHVVVFSEMCIVPNDSFMERFALACPHLVCLTFYSSCAPMDSDWLDPQATLRSLVYLVQHCPQLDSVGMGIDTSDVDTLSLPRKGCFNTRIQDIDVGKAPLRGDPARVGAFLFALFPKITDFTDQFTDSKPRTWKPVVKAIEKLRLQHPATDCEFNHGRIGTHVTYIESRLNLLTTWGLRTLVAAAYGPFAARVPQTPVMSRQRVVSLAVRVLQCRVQMHMYDNHCNISLMESH